MRSRFCTDRVACTRVLVLAALVVSSPTHAESWQITPSIAVSETLTDNGALAPDDRKQSDLITQVTPGIRIDGRGGRVNLNLNYRMTQLLYARNSAHSDTQNYLDAFGTLEAVENWFFVDARGSITQQGISAFGPLPTATGNVNRNRTETSTYQLSPYIRGRLGTAAEYLLRYDWTTTSSGGSALADVQTQDLIGRINGTTALAALGWAIDGSNQTVNYDAARDSELTRLRATLIYSFDPQIRASATGGWEANNYTSVDKQERTTYGGGFDWTPTARTGLSLFRERRFFGDGHAYSVRHRTRLTAWQFSDTKDVTVLPNQLALAGQGTAFDLLFNALASRIPDPVARRQEVQRLLQQNAIPADLGEARFLLTTRATVTRTRQASFAILGVRNTVTFAANISDQQALGVGAGTVDDFSLSSTIRTRGISLDWAHRLSPLSTINVLATQAHSTAIASSALESTQSLVHLLFSHQVSPKTVASVGARLVRFDGAGASDYREKAVTVSLSMTF